MQAITAIRTIILPLLATELISHRGAIVHASACSRFTHRPMGYALETRGHCGSSSRNGGYHETRTRQCRACSWLIAYRPVPVAGSSRSGAHGTLCVRRTPLSYSASIHSGFKRSGLEYWPGSRFRARAYRRFGGVYALPGDWIARHGINRYRTHALDTCGGASTENSWFVAAVNGHGVPLHIPACE